MEHIKSNKTSKPNKRCEKQMTCLKTNGNPKQRERGGTTRMYATSETDEDYGNEII